PWLLARDGGAQGALREGAVLARSCRRTRPGTRIALRFGGPRGAHRAPDGWPGPTARGHVRQRALRTLVVRGSRLAGSGATRARHVGCGGRDRGRVPRPRAAA